MIPKITTTSLLISLFALLCIVYIIHRLKRDEIGIRSALFWFILWFSIAFFSLFPDMLSTFMAFAQMQNRMFFITLFSLFCLFALVFNLYSTIDRIKRDISRVIQEIAIINHNIAELKNEIKRKGKTGNTPDNQKNG